MQEGVDMHCVCPAHAEVELPRRLSDCGDGVDVLSAATGEIVMRLRFDGKPIPAGFAPYQRTWTGWTRTHADGVDLQGLLSRLQYNI
jgi:hypothetical protein